MERGVIDRFEGDIAVIEIGGVTKVFPRSALSPDLKVGDAVILEDGKITLDETATRKRKKEIQDLMDELFE